MLPQNADQLQPVRIEYTDYVIVAQVLTRDGFDQKVITPEQITGHSLQSLEFGIIWYRVGDGAIPISVDQFNQYWEAIQSEAIAPTPAPVPEYYIAFSYDNNGTQVDVVMQKGDNLLDCRHCWVEFEGLDGEPVFMLETRNGKTVKSSWATAKNNKWLNAYRHLWTKRNTQRVKQLEAIARQSQDDDVEYISRLEESLCYADLAGW